jgi:hypothetical protein
MEAVTERVPPEPRTSKVLREMRDEEEQSLREWIDGLAGDGAIRVAIRRKKPMIGPNGENVAGSLETVEERIDEDYLREVWGGGQFEIRTFKPNAKGTYEYFKTRTLSIAGEPKMNGRVLVGGAAAPVAAEEDGLAERAFQVMERNAQRAQDRAEKLEQMGQRSGGLDLSALQALQAPVLAELAEARASVRELQQQVLAAATRPAPADPFRDKMLDRMMDGDTARIEALRTQYDTRIEKMQDSFDDRMRRLEEKHADELKSQEKRHEREIALTERGSDMQTKSADVAYNARVDALKSENDRLNRELTEARGRIGSLELRKDQTITDKADELIKIKEALEGLGGGDGDDKNKAWYEKVIDAVGNSEVAMGFINKIGGATGAGGPEAQQQQPMQQQMMPPVGVPFQGPDGNIYVRNPDDSMSQIDPAALRQQRALAAARKKRKAQAAVAPAGEAAVAPEAPLVEIEEDEPKPKARPPKASEVRAALAFMENAIRSNADPAMFGATARNLIPSEILAYMQQVGIDEFLNNAKLEIGSPLTTQAGRNFARKVFRYLTEGTTG